MYTHDVPETHIQEMCDSLLHSGIYYTGNTGYLSKLHPAFSERRIWLAESALYGDHLGLGLFAENPTGKFQHKCDDDR